MPLNWLIIRAQSIIILQVVVAVVVFMHWRLGELQRKQNEMILTTSLDDLEQLMFKYQDLIKLSTSFNKLIKQPPSTTSGVVIPALVLKSSPLYHQELSRHISEFSINFKLTQKTSMISSQDLFADIIGFLLETKDLSELVNCDDFKCAIVKIKFASSG